jgi:ribonucleoside-diphosphate reductase alpha chain
MWDNRNYYNGISVLPYNGGTYVQAPFEDITKEKYEEMLPYLKNINIGQVFESNGAGVDLASELACSGAGCDII